MSLTQRLFALVALAFLPAGLVLGVLNADLQNARETEVRETAVQQTQRAAAEIERLTEGLRTLLLAVASAPVVRGFETDRCSSYLNAIREALPYIVTVMVLDLAGDLRCADFNDGRTANYADRDYFKETIASGELVIGPYTAGRLNPQIKALPFAFPIRVDGRITGVVVAVLKLDHLDAIVRQWSLPAGGGLTIADRDGVILARNPFPERFVGMRIPEPFQAWVRADRSGVEEVVSQDGTVRLQAYKPVSVAPVGLYISSGISLDSSYAALTDARRRGLWLLAATAVLASAAALFVAVVSIRRPVRELVALADAWRAGRPEAAPRQKGATEFSAIAAALDRMGEGLRAEQAAVRTQEEQLRRMIRAAPVPLMLHAEDGEILAISEAWFVRSGYDPVGRASDWFRAALKGSGGENDPAVAAPGRAWSAPSRPRPAGRASGNSRPWRSVTCLMAGPSG